MVAFQVKVLRNSGRHLHLVLRPIEIVLRINESSINFLCNAKHLLANACTMALGNNCLIPLPRKMIGVWMRTAHQVLDSYLRATVVYQMTSVQSSW